MKAIMDSIRYVIRHDPILQAYVGVDADGEFKLYEVVAKSDSVAPYVVYSILPNSVSMGVYGDDNVIEQFATQFNVWGRNPTESWQITDALKDALLRGDYASQPYELAKVRRDGMPVESPDRDTNLRLVYSQYIFMFSR